MKIALLVVSLFHVISVHSFHITSSHDRRWTLNAHHESSRRSYLSSIVTTATILTTTTPSIVYAAKPDITVEEAFAKVKFELNDPKGGVAYLQQQIDKEDFAAILEFSKEYDQVLRKAGMVRAKKLLTDKEAKEKATSFANNVTFDLIGINRSCRPGQQSKEQAQKYLDELKQDVASFLALEPSTK